MQISDGCDAFDLDSSPTDVEGDGAADGVVEGGLERHEGQARRPIDPEQHVARLQTRRRGRTLWQHLRHHEHPALRSVRAHPPLDFPRQAEPHGLVVRLVCADHLERAARHRLAGLDERERPCGAVEG